MKLEWTPLFMWTVVIAELLLLLQLLKDTSETIESEASIIGEGGSVQEKVLMPQKQKFLEDESGLVNYVHNTQNSECNVLCDHVSEINYSSEVFTTY
jgi:peroxiredoxin